MKELGVLKSKLAEDMEAVRARVRDELRVEFQGEKEKMEADHAEELRRVREQFQTEREEFQKEKEDLVRLHDVAKAEAVREAQVAAVRQYRSSPSFGKVLADAMTKTVIAIRKKVCPENPGVRWNTRAMVEHVQMWLREKRSLEPDTESEDEKDEEGEDESSEARDGETGVAADKVAVDAAAEEGGGECNCN
ncbi:unnamed protein product [Linum trigynum]|uniref:Uncharacterized protein n=1 Tax=Linum trigynum TaxID=586398 RepID=A0AAV2ETM6_9ROSI